MHGALSGDRHVPGAVVDPHHEVLCQLNLPLACRTRALSIEVAFRSSTEVRYAVHDFVVVGAWLHRLHLELRHVDAIVAGQGRLNQAGKGKQGKPEEGSGGVFSSHMNLRAGYLYLL